MNRLLASILAVQLAAGALTCSAEEQHGERPWLGVWLRNSVDGGVEVVSLVRGSPADRAQLRAGDIVLEIGGRPVSDQEALEHALSAHRPGDALALTLVRLGAPLKRQVILGRRRTAPRAVPDRLFRPGLASVGTPLGVHVIEITPDLRRHYGAPPDVGVLVTRVETLDTSAGQGLIVGDVLLEADNEPIRSRAELRAAIGRWGGEQPLTLKVVRGDRPRVVTIGDGLERTPGALARTHEERQRRHQTRRIDEEIERLEQLLSELRQERQRLAGDD